MNRVEPGLNLSLAIQRVFDSPDLPSDHSFHRWVSAVLIGRYNKAELVIRIVDQEEGRALNRHYRDKDYATNILSFSSGVPDVVETDLLGDLVITAPVVSHEAREQGKPLHAHWAHLVIHGVLHLLGFDHQTADEAGEMEDLEITILARLGIPNPYLCKQEA